MPQSIETKINEILELRSLRAGIDKRLRNLGACETILEAEYITKQEMADVLAKARDFRSRADAKNPFALDALMWLERALRQ